MLLDTLRSIIQSTLSQETAVINSEDAAELTRVIMNEIIETAKREGMRKNENK